MKKRIQNKKQELETLVFSWEDTDTETYYRLIEKKDGLLHLVWRLERDVY